MFPYNKKNTERHMVGPGVRKHHSGSANLRSVSKCDAINGLRRSQHQNSIDAREVFHSEPPVLRFCESNQEAPVFLRDDPFTCYPARHSGGIEVEMSGEWSNTPEDANCYLSGT